MGFFDLFSRARSAAPGQGERTEPALQASNVADYQSTGQWKGALAVGGIPSVSGARVSEETVIGLPATLQALRILTGVFAMTPLHFYRMAKTGRERVRDDIGRLLLDRPNSNQTAFEYRELMMGDIMLAGAHYAYISRNRSGIPVALTRVLPNSVVISRYFDRAEGETFFFDVTLPDGTRERLPGRDVFHVRGFSRDGIYGLNPIRFAREALGGALATSHHANRFWASGGMLQTVLQTKHKIGPEDKRRIRSDWDSMYGGINGHKTAVLDQDLTAQVLSPDHTKSQFIETREFQVVDLARIWGVPPHLLFDLSRATFSNIEHQSMEFVTYHLGPHFARVEQAATRAFAPEDHYFEHQTAALVRGDMKTRMEAYWLQRQMGMQNANELRGHENLPDIPGEAGTEYWRPGNMQVAGQPAPSAPAERVQTRD